jgi:predicted RNA-binding Zn ribbon-like protein
MTQEHASRRLRRTPKPPISMATPDPSHIGGHFALDFLNTIASPHGEPVESLEDGRALLRWLVQIGALSRGEARAIADRVPPTELDALARRARALREWLRPIVTRSAKLGRAQLAPGEVRHLNAVLERGSRFLELAPGERGYAARARLRCDSLDAVLAAIAEGIADLLAGGDFTLVRPCANPACTLWFLDRTKAHRRQWCSMEACGNRAKVAAHRERARRAATRR